MRRRFENWLQEATQSRWAEYWLVACAFFNSFITPVPAEALLAPLCLANQARCWRYAGIATIAAVLGGIMGYAIGAAAYSSIGAPIVEFYDAETAFTQAKEQFNAAGVQWILLATITPLPYKVVTITSGAAGLHWGLFLVASVIGRAIGYYLLAALLWRFRDEALGILKSPVAQFAALLTLALGAYVLLI